ncbi:glycosyltransferase 87 family protein [Streptomyces sp. 5-10]|uniref:glycosyltransferase 87 family protein n=1 Tax=Streptomyces sp. 5-10 TaxID=878925 RepID=UPI00295F20D9|nr:glycosyltransferase 87 family protein [Streptomyces sp. 5-10]
MPRPSARPTPPERARTAPTPPSRMRPTPPSQVRTAPPSQVRTARRWGTPVALATLLGSLVAVLALTFRRDDFHTAPGTLSRWYAIAWAVFAAAAWTVRRLGARQATVFVLVGSAAVAATGLLAPPRTSTDAYRYAWDGRVQAAGMSPYDHAPEDPALASLRDRWLFPQGSACRGPDRAPVRPTPVRPGPEHPAREHRGAVPRADPEPDHPPSASAEPQCTRLNRPSVHTIYPPAAEGYFLLVHRSAPSGSTLLPLQAGGALLSVATTAVLLAAARRRSDPRLATARAALWAWCPAVPVEAVNNAHVDALGVLLTVAGLVAVPRRHVLGGALLGAATAAKLLPAVTLPGALSGVLATAVARPLTALKRPRPAGSPASPTAPTHRATPTHRAAPTRRATPIRRAAAIVLPATAVVALGYLPYVLLSHSSVLGYLTGYVAEEGYGTDSTAADDKNRYALLRLLRPDPEAWALPVIAAVLLVVVAWVLLRGDPQRPWRGALVVTGTAFLLMTPGYPWYALLVVALVALDGRWEWLGVPLAGVAQYVTARAVDDGAWVGTLGYAVACAAVMAGWALRARRAASAASAPRPKPPKWPPRPTRPHPEPPGDAATPGSPSGSPATAPRRRRVRR